LIDRTFVGKEYPPCSVEFDANLGVQLKELFGRISSKLEETSSGSSPEPPSQLSFIWPAILTLRGTAGLLTVWEDMGVDPMHIRLVREEFEHHKIPAGGHGLVGKITIEEIVERVEPEEGIEDQVELLVEFTDARGILLATYRCSFRSPVARPVK
jgi:hypothetical protein